MIKMRVDVRGSEVREFLMIPCNHEHLKCVSPYDDVRKKLRVSEG
jgi:hypothetical protein